METKTQDTEGKEWSHEEAPGSTLVDRDKAMRKLLPWLLGTFGVAVVAGVILYIAAGPGAGQVKQATQDAVGYLKVVEIRAGDPPKAPAATPPVPFDIKETGRGAGPGVAAKTEPPPAPSIKVKVVEKTPPPDTSKSDGKAGDKAADQPDPAPGKAKPAVAGTEVGVGHEKAAPRKKAEPKEPGASPAGRYAKAVVPGKTKSSVRIIFKGDDATVNKLATDRLLTVGVLLEGAKAAHYYPMPGDDTVFFDGPVTDACYYLKGYGERDGVSRIVQLGGTLIARIDQALKTAGSAGTVPLEITPDGDVRALLQRQ